MTEFLQALNRLQIAGWVFLIVRFLDKDFVTDTSNCEDIWNMVSRFHFFSWLQQIAWIHDGVVGSCKNVENCFSNKRSTVRWQ